MNSSLLLASCCFFTALTASSVRAQTCSSTLTTPTSTISVTTGGVQTITLTVTPAPVGGTYFFSMIGSFSGTSPGFAYFADGGLFLNRDRYMDVSYAGRSPFLPGGVPGTPGGHVLVVDSTGIAVQNVVVPPNLWTSLVGRTVHHGVYNPDSPFGLPYCGSNSVALTFVP